MKNMFKIILLEERIVLDAAAAAVIYVNAHAATGGDGSSWAHAYNNVQDALVKAASTPGADQVWIAQGTYTPSQIYSPSGVTGGASGLNNSHLATFNLPNNVSLYGGFVGTETSLSQANPTLHPTILSGDLNGNDINNTNDPGFLASKADNVWHVVTAGNDLTDTGVTAKLDGLTITGGFAAGPNGTGFTHENGGGLYIRFGSQITVNNDVMKNNSAAMVSTGGDGGGAIAAMDLGTHLTVTNSLFNNNNASIYQDPRVSGIPFNNLEEGGSIYSLKQAVTDISNSTFLNSSSTHDGGAINYTDSGGTIVDSTFMGNKALSGGGITLQPDSGINPSLTVSGSLFLNNHADHVGGGIEVISYNPPDSSGLVKVTNTLFVHNDGDIIGGGMVVDGYNALISGSTFIGNFSNGGGGGLAVTQLNSSLFGLPLIDTVSVQNSNFVGNQVIGTSYAAQELLNILGGPPFGVALIEGGGALLTSGNGNTNIASSTFTNNSVTNGEGGAIMNGGADLSLFGFLHFAIGGNTTITNSVFTNNTSDRGGGAVASDSLFTRNTPNNTSLSLSNSLFKNNDTTNGGAVLVHNSVAGITGNTFYQSNDASLLGDDIYAISSTVNGYDTSTQASLALHSIINSNLVQHLDSDDIYIA